MAAEHQIIAIVGPTASGKSSLAMHLAKKYRGEIICADSRTIYRGMDIGTAKPSPTDQRAVVHYCLDLINPNETFSAAQFKKQAEEAIKIIITKGKIPIVVGGSGLYIDALLYDYSFPEQLSLEEISDLDLSELQSLAHQKGLKVPEQIFKNKRHLAGFIKRGGKSGQRELKQDVLLIGLYPPKDVLDERIQQRIETMFKEGFLDEVKTLLKIWDKNASAFLTPGYKPAIDYIQGSIDLETAKKEFIRNDKLLAKKQVTWFKRNKAIHWIDSLKQAEQLIEASFKNI